MFPRYVPLMGFVTEEQGAKVDSYLAVSEAQIVLSKAASEYLQVRRDNYLMRGVSPTGAWKHAVDDLKQILEQIADKYPS